MAHNTRNSIFLQIRGKILQVLEHHPQYKKSFYLIKLHDICDITWGKTFPTFVSVYRLQKDPSFGNKWMVLDEGLYVCLGHFVL